MSSAALVNFSVINSIALSSTLFPCTSQQAVTLNCGSSNPLTLMTGFSPCSGHDILSRSLPISSAINLTFIATCFLVEFNKCSYFPGQGVSRPIGSAPGIIPANNEESSYSYCATTPGGYCVPADFMERIEIRHDGRESSALQVSKDSNGQGLRHQEKSMSGRIESASWCLINPSNNGRI